MDRGRQITAAERGLMFTQKGNDKMKILLTTTVPAELVEKYAGFEITVPDHRMSYEEVSEVAAQYDAILGTS